MKTKTIEKALIRGSWGLLIGSILGWPISALTIAASEPKVVLGLSWFAIILTAGTMLLEGYIKRDIREEKDSK